MNIVVLAGIPGTGSTTVLNKVLEEINYVNINYGNVMFDIAQEKGLVASRDDMRKLDPEKSTDIITYYSFDSVTKLSKGEIVELDI